MNMITEVLCSTVEGFGVILILMLIDLVTGLLKALKSDEKISSFKLRNSINKLILYFVVIIIGSCVKYFGEAALFSLFVGFLLLVEGVSILENLQVIFPKFKFLEGLKQIVKKEKNKKL